MAPLEHCYESLFVFLWGGSQFLREGLWLREGCLCTSFLNTTVHGPAHARLGAKRGGPSLSVGTGPEGEAVPGLIAVVLG